MANAPPLLHVDRMFGNEGVDPEKLADFGEDRVFNDLRYTINNDKLLKLGWKEVRLKTATVRHVRRAPIMAVAAGCPWNAANLMSVVVLPRVLPVTFW